MFQMLIEFDQATGRVNVKYPQNKVICDFMLCEARRMLDRIDAEAASKGNGQKIVIPEIRVRPPRT